MSERKTLFVDVILPVPIRYEFTYRVPFELNDQLFAGSRVIVPFGKAKLLTGIVTKIHENVPLNYPAKYVEYLLDDEPIITENQYKFWKWIASYYMAPIGDVMNAALPSNFKLASETKVVLHPEHQVEHRFLTEREIDVIEALEIRETLDLKEISEIVGIKTIQPLIKSLIDKRAIITVEALNEKFVAKKVVYIGLAPELTEELLEGLLEQLQNSPGKIKQLDALLLLLREGNYSMGRMEAIERKKIIQFGVSASTLKTLEKNGIIVQENRTIARFDKTYENLNEFKELSEAQKLALSEIHEGFDEKRVCLLHGVTGSGKTEIYVQLIQEQLDLGKQALFLLPEIALTTQLIQRLSSYFGEQIGVYHSKFNQNERVEIWNHVLKNDPHKFRIILGARSSVFLPFSDLGLVIVDEEHESTFKQYDPSPRYNARDASIILAQLFGAHVLLGSATPSMESYHNAEIGKFKLIELKDRYGAATMPELLVANVRKERRQKSMVSDFTSFLLDSMREALNLNEQIILFQNRRGYTPLWVCEVCNWTPKCVNCDVSLTYHKHSNTLKCHYCGYASAPIGSCTACGSNRLQMLGFGTEKIEDDLALIFPDKKIERLDLDTTRSKNAYATIINKFDDGQIDILIGTQMISKGLDFSNVNLVGVLDADMLLNRTDFRAFERSFQLITQVAGRAGRREKRGKVIIQTGDPDHWVIEKIVNNDYIGFYRSELIERANFFYPPHYKIIEITLRHKDENQLNEAANALAQELRNVFKERVLGPEFPIVRKIQQYFLKSIVLKIEKSAPDKKVKERIQLIIDQFYSVPSNKSIRIATDVDPA